MPALTGARFAALAIASAQRGMPTGPLVAFGEIGLTGRLRPAAQSERRLEECAKLGIRNTVAPEGTRSRSAVRVSGSATLRDALRAGLEQREENPRKSG